jgi:hypothetical protein
VALLCHSCSRLHPDVGYKYGLTPEFFDEQNISPNYESVAVTMSEVEFPTAA